MRTPVASTNAQRHGDLLPISLRPAVPRDWEVRRAMKAGVARRWPRTFRWRTPPTLRLPEADRPPGASTLEPTVAPSPARRGIRRQLREVRSWRWYVVLDCGTHAPLCWIACAITSWSGAGCFMVTCTFIT